MLIKWNKISVFQEARQKIRLFHKRAKRLRCPREGCEKFYQNIPGFEYHVLRCGGVSLSYPCETCGSVYKSAMGLAYHSRLVHKTQAEVRILFIKDIFNCLHALYVANIKISQTKQLWSHAWAVYFIKKIVKTLFVCQALLTFFTVKPLTFCY